MGHTLTRRGSNPASQTPTFRVELMPSARADLKALPPDVRARVGAAFDRLARNPSPTGSKPLKGKLAGSRSLRVGDYRASYTVDHDARLVRVWRVGHRSTFYKRLQH